VRGNGLYSKNVIHVASARRRKVLALGAFVHLSPATEFRAGLNHKSLARAPECEALRARPGGCRESQAARQLGHMQSPQV